MRAFRVSLLLLPAMMWPLTITAAAPPQTPSSPLVRAQGTVHDVTPPGLRLQDVTRGPDRGKGQPPGVGTDGLLELTTDARTRLTGAGAIADIRAGDTVRVAYRIQQREGASLNVATSIAVTRAEPSSPRDRSHEPRP